MVNSDVSGVGFSRHPLKPLSSNCVLLEAVYGLGEGLVSGALEADRYEVIITSSVCGCGLGRGWCQVSGGRQI